jgi:hypothetical protein
MKKLYMKILFLQAPKFLKDRTTCLRQGEIVVGQQFNVRCKEDRLGNT